MFGLILKVMILERLHKNYLLQLLFSQRGSISRREYIVGFLTLCFCLMTCFLFVCREAFLWIPGMLFDDSFFLFREFIHKFIPQCIPLFLIMCYSTIVLTIKRGKDLGLSKVLLWAVSSFGAIFYVAVVITLYTYWYEINLELVSINILTICMVTPIISAILLYCLKGKRDGRVKYCCRDTKQIKYLFQISSMYAGMSIIFLLLYSISIELNFAEEIILGLSISYFLACSLFLILRRIGDITFGAGYYLLLLVVIICYKCLFISINSEIFGITAFSSHLSIKLLDSISYTFVLWLSVLVLFSTSTYKEEISIA